MFVPGRLFRHVAAPVCALIVSVLASSMAAAQAAPTQAATAASLSGTWSIDREASEFPREIGFGADFLPGPRGDSAPGGDRRRGGLAPALRPQGESYDAAQRRQVLTDEARTPPARLTISDTPDAITMTDENGHSRTFHPDGRAEPLEIGSVSILTVARREAGKLVVLYSVADLRQIRYTYSRTDNPAQLAVEVQFLERGTGDAVRRIYTSADAAASAPRTTSAGAPGGSAPGNASAPPAAMPRAGSEFSGLTRLGIVVEPLSTQAQGCGLSADALEAAASKPFTDAGLKVSRNSDEDTYVHVSVMTSTLPNGMCISRYDWSIYSTTEATLSYQHSPLLAQVLLAHKGGLTGSLPATHPADVTRSLADGLSQIAGIIRDANK